MKRKTKQTPEHNPPLAEHYHLQLEERMQEVEPVIDDPLAKWNEVEMSIAKNAGKVGAA